MVAIHVTAFPPLALTPSAALFFASFSHRYRHFAFRSPQKCFAHDATTTVEHLVRHHSHRRGSTVAGCARRLCFHAAARHTGEQ